MSAHAAESLPALQYPAGPVACDAGYTGKKFPMRTKTCPDGKITDGLTFDYSNCKPAGRENVDLNATDCSITPTAVGCMPVPTLSGCPVGKHWTLAGSKIAHCVNNDPVCPWGTSLTHDFGNVLYSQYLSEQSGIAIRWYFLRLSCQLTGVERVIMCCSGLQLVYQ